MDTDTETSQKLSREDSDLEDFNLPNKRHRTQRSPQKTSMEIDTNNSFSPLDAEEYEFSHRPGVSSISKSNSSADSTLKQVKHSKVNTDLQKHGDQTSSKVKLQKNFSVSHKSSSSKSEQLNNFIN